MKDTDLTLTLPSQESLYRLQQTAKGHDDPEVRQIANVAIMLSGAVKAMAQLAVLRGGVSIIRESDGVSVTDA